MIVRALTAITSLALLVVAPVQSGLSRTVAGFHTSAAAQQAADPYSPIQLATAYGVSPLWQQGIRGSGQKIAIIGFDHWSQSDIASFSSNSGLAAPTIQ